MMQLQHGDRFYLLQDADGLQFGFEVIASPARSGSSASLSAGLLSASQLQRATSADTAGLSVEQNGASNAAATALPQAKRQRTESAVKPPAVAAMDSSAAALQPPSHPPYGAGCAERPGGGQLRDNFSLLTYNIWWAA
jgi:hypothetical protein